MKRSQIKPGAKSLERRSTFEAPRSELRSDPETTKAWQERSNAKAAAKERERPRRQISPASKEQREKVRDAVSIVSGETPCDPAHLWPRGMGGCDHPDCVVPLTRAEHRAFDGGQLDVLPYLVAHGMWAELAHMVAEHRVDPVSMLLRLTGERYVPEREAPA